MNARTALSAVTLLATLAGGAAASTTLNNYATGIGTGAADIEFIANGTLYATGGAGGNGKLYVVPPGGGAATEVALSGGSLFFPWGLATSPGGVLHIIDRGDQSIANSGRILRFTPTGPATGTLAVFKSSMAGPFAGVFDAAGNLYVSLSVAHKIVKIASDGTMTDYATGIGTVGELTMGLSFDAAGNLYAGAENDMYRIGPGGAPVTKVIAGGLHEAMGHVRFGNDNFIVANYGFHQLVYWSPIAGYQPLLNTAAPTLCNVGPVAYPDSPGSARMSQPTGMRIFAGTVYAADYGCHNVRSFDLGDFLATPASSTSWGRVKVLYR